MLSRTSSLIKTLLKTQNNTTIPWWWQALALENLLFLASTQEYEYKGKFIITLPVPFLNMVKCPSLLGSTSTILPMKWNSATLMPQTLVWMKNSCWDHNRPFTSATYMCNNLSQQEYVTQNDTANELRIVLTAHTWCCDLHRGTVNLPSLDSDVAVIAPGTIPTEQFGKVAVTIHLRGGRLKTVNAIHPAYDPLSCASSTTGVPRIPHWTERCQPKMLLPFPSTSAKHCSSLQFTAPWW